MVRLPSYSGHVVTEFRFEPRDASDDHDVPDSPWFLTPDQVRQLNAQVKAW